MHCKEIIVLHINESKLSPRRSKHIKGAKVCLGQYNQKNSNGIHYYKYKQIDNHLTKHTNIAFLFACSQQNSVHRSFIEGFNGEKEEKRLPLLCPPPMHSIEGYFRFSEQLQT
jgi:hypothetical protein